MRRLLALCSIAAMTMPAVLAAQPTPPLVHVQGVLLDAGGVKVSAAVSMTFRVYDAPVGGVALWDETHASVTVDNGVFNVALGGESLTPLTIDLFNASERYLAVQVGSDAEMTPRQRFLTVPYALLARRAVTADAVDWTKVANVPAAFVDGVDNDTLASLSCNNGDVAKRSGGNWVCAVESDPTVNALAKAALTCADEDVPKWNAGLSQWECRPDADTQLTEAQVESYVTNGPIDLAAGTTLGGAAISTGQWATTGNDIYSANTGNVGIGTTSPDPAVKLDVNGGILALSGTYFGGDVTVGINRDASNSLSIRTGNADGRVVVAGGGNVGIGTTDPGVRRLKVVGDIEATGAVYGTLRGTNLLSGLIPTFANWSTNPGTAADIASNSASLTTAGSTNNATGGYITYDLGSPVFFVAQATVSYLGGGIGQNVEIQASYDGSAWTVITSPPGAASRTNFLEGGSGFGRHVRLYVYVGGNSTSLTRTSFNVFKLGPSAD